MSMWASVFFGVAVVAAMFGFGLIASATVAQALTVIFLLLAGGSYAAHLHSRR